MSHYRAARLPRHRGVAAWDAILPPRAAHAPLRENATADVVIIGAGFAGLAAAERLKALDPALNISVLEAGQIGQGAAGRNSGFMIDLPHELTSHDYAGSGDDRAVIALNRQAQAFLGDAVMRYQINPAYFDRWGKINGAVSDDAHAANLSYTRHLDTLGEEWEALDQKQMREITGSGQYQSGVYTKGTVILQSAGLVREFSQGLANQGVRFHEASPVTFFEKKGRTWRVHTDHAFVDAQNVILSVNGHLESFGIAKGRLMHIFLFAMMTQELDDQACAAIGGQPRWGVTPSDPMGTTLRRIDTPQGGRRIVTRTTAVMRSDMQSRKSDLERATSKIRSKFDLHFPQLAGIQMGYTWAGHLCLSRNSVSHSQKIEEGVYSACVQNGLGTVRGTLTGIAAAERVLGYQSEITRRLDDEPEPTKLPPQPFRDIGANSMIRWREYRASSE